MLFCLKFTYQPYLLAIYLQSLRGCGLSEIKFVQGCCPNITKFR